MRSDQTGFLQRLSILRNEPWALHGPYLQSFTRGRIFCAVISWRALVIICSILPRTDTQRQEEQRRDTPQRAKRTPRGPHARTRGNSLFGKLHRQLTSPRKNGLWSLRRSAGRCCTRAGQAAGQVAGQTAGSWAEDTGRRRWWFVGCDAGSWAKTHCTVNLRHRLTT